MTKAAVAKQGIGIRLACVCLGISEACYRYEARLSYENTEIADWLIRLTHNRRNWGFGLCYLFLRNVKGFAWNHMASGIYAYYLCSHKGCGSYGKSIKRDALEIEFEKLLKEIQPTPALFRVAVAMFEKIWTYKAENHKNAAEAFESERVKIEKQIEVFIERILTAETALVIATYEKRIQMLEEQKLLLDEKIANCNRSPRSFEESLRTALDFLASPWKLWTSGRFEDKRLVLRLAFADHLIYVRNEGFRTAVPSLPFKYLAGFAECKFEMVELDGIEPSTSCMPCKRSPS